ncbi:MAG: hypothetical protein OEZ54_00035 [Gemmatimonadota bacterium]|nr:hypothetical protein [Gemmatimonadota bacterium]
MRNRIIWVLAGLGLMAGEISAQTVPDDSPAARVDIGYRRFSQFRPDPFRYTLVPHWGIVLNFGATVDNTVFQVNDVRAFKTITSLSNIYYTDIFDLITKVPPGQGIGASAQLESGAYIGGPFTKNFAIGASVQARSYGVASLAPDVVSILRDGNLVNQTYTLGESRVNALLTAEVGGHGIIRLNPLEMEDGMILALGFGVRQIRPVFYANLQATDPNGTVIVSPDSVGGSVGLNFDKTASTGAAGLQNRAEGALGSSWVTDYVVRLEWPTSGVAMEAMVANVGTLTIPDVERATPSIEFVTPDLVQFADSAEITLLFNPTDTLDVVVEMPRIVRFSTSAWANDILQIDFSGTLPITGDFETPLVVDIGTTWRFSSTFPLRIGMVLGGHQGIGYTAGFTTETRNSFLQVGAQTLGGWLGKGRGVGVRADLGFFF